MSVQELGRQADAINALASQEFTELAKRLAVDENAATPAEIANTLADSRHCASDLSNLVATLQHRAELRQQMSQVGAMKERVQEIRKQIELENGILETSVRLHCERCAPLQREAFILEKEVSESVTLPSQLQQCCPDEILQSRFRKLEGDILRLRDAVRSADKDVENCRAELRGETEGPARERLLGIEKRLQTEAQKANAAFAAAATEREEIAQRMIAY